MTCACKILVVQLTVGLHINIYLTVSNKSSYAFVRGGIVDRTQLGKKCV